MRSGLWLTCRGAHSTPMPERKKEELPCHRHRRFCPQCPPPDGIGPAVCTHGDPRGPSTGAAPATGSVRDVTTCEVALLDPRLRGSMSSQGLPAPPLWSKRSRVTSHIDAFLLHLATERGLSVNYQLLVRRVLRPSPPGTSEEHESEDIATVTTQHLELPSSAIAKRMASPLQSPRGADCGEDLLPLAVCPVPEGGDPAEPVPAARVEAVSARHAERTGCAPAAGVRDWHGTSGPAGPRHPGGLLCDGSPDRRARPGPGWKTSVWRRVGVRVTGKGNKTRLVPGRRSRSERHLPLPRVVTDPARQTRRRRAGFS